MASLAMRAGPLAALASAVLFGVSTPLAKPLLGAVEPQLLAGLLYLGSGLGLALAWPWLRRGPHAHEAALGRADWPWLLAAILTGGVAAPVLLLLGLARVPAGTASLLLTLESVLTLALAWIAFREPVDRRLALGAAAILAGAVTLAWQGAPVPGAGLGMAAIAAACLGWALDNNLTRKVALADPVQIAMLKGLVAGAVNTGLALAAGAAWPGAGTLALAALLGLVAYGVSLVLFVTALRLIGTARTGAYFATAPFVGAALAVLLGEPLGPRLLLAGALMAFGVWLHLSEWHEHEHEHPDLAHAHRHRHDAHHAHAHGPGAPPGEPHSHWHVHAPLRHRHPHFPDAHHRHLHPHDGAA